MKNKIVKVLCAGVIFVLLTASAVFASDFSAEMVNQTKGGVFRGKIYVTFDKVRMDTPQAITITRMDKKVVWILMPETNTYLEQAFDPSSIAATSADVPGEFERELLGKEMVGGRMTEKYRIVYKQDGRSYTMFHWIDPSINMPVKAAAGDGSWTMEYKNINIGGQPDSLFELPAGYQKMSFEMPDMGNLLKRR
ncbi:hypothetical protein ACFLZ3_05255 [Candidatus Omnitrophota bacterium]